MSQKIISFLKRNVNNLKTILIVIFTVFLIYLQIKHHIMMAEYEESLIKLSNSLKSIEPQ